MPLGPFDFFSPTRIAFGRGRLAELGAVAAALGRHALLVTGRSSARAAGLLDEVCRLLAAAGVGATPFAVAGEPEVETVDRAAGAARAEGCDLVIAVGGGSCLDAAKAAALLAANGGSALDYLEVIGRGMRPQRPGLPLVAVPTTAGTGAEATRNAVLGHAPSRRKASLRHEFLLPRVALVDPALTDGLPPAVTAASGLDALTQLLEAYLSRGANPLTDALALDGLRRAARALPAASGLTPPGRAGAPAPGTPSLRAARDDMALAALESGLCLGGAGLGVIHGISGPLGGRFPVPHGFACAALLPHAFAANARALLAAGAGSAPASAGSPAGSAAVRKLVPLARALGVPVEGDDPRAAAEGVTAFLHDLVRRLAVPRLGAFGVTRESLGEIAWEALASSSTRYNPAPLTAADLEAILAAAL